MGNGTTRVLHRTDSDDGSLTTLGIARTATTLLRRTDLRGIESDDELAASLGRWRQSITVEGGIARYVLGNRLGQGSQGAVFSVRDRDTNRVIALKTLLGRVTAPDDVSRFLHEVQVTAQLEHPGIVPVHDFGILPDGTVFYAMKRVEGQVLTDWLKNRAGHPQRRHEVIQCFLRMAETMAFAHSRGVVHRDLKPRNIMVGNYGEVLIMDWGLAKVLGGHEAPAPESDSDLRVQAQHDHETMHGTAVGTPAYMSPEQARGDSTAVDHRADIYALGVIFYEMLAGASPYLRGDLRRTVEQVVHGLWTPLDRQPTCGQLPRRMVAIVHKAMAFRADDRYQHIAELTNDINSFLAGQAVSAYRESPAEVVARVIDRHRRVLVWGLASVVAIAVLSGGFIWLGTRADARKVDELRQEASLAASRGDWKAAHDYTQNILGLRPRDPEALRLATLYAERVRIDTERRTEAKTAREQAERNVRKAKALQADARAASLRGGINDLESAVALIRQAQLLAGSDEISADWDAYAKQLAMLRERQRQDEEARSRIATAADLSTQADRALVNGDVDDAIGKLRSSLSLVPEASRQERLEVLVAQRASRQQAELRSVREEEQAAARLRRQHEADRELTQVDTALARGDAEAAAGHLERAAGILPEHPGLAQARERVVHAEAAGRAARAEALVARARTAIVTATQLADTLVANRDEVRRLRAELADTGDTQRRSALAAAEDACAEAVRRRAAALAEAVAELNRALALAPGHPPVRAALASFWVDRLTEAEAEGDSAAAAAAEAQARAYDDGPHADLLAGLVRVVNRSGRAISLAPIVRRPDRTDRPDDQRQEVPADADLAVTHGRYLVAAADGVRTAMRLVRGQRCELRLPALPAGMPDGAVFVPGGRVVDGDGRGTAVAPFVMQEREVTCGEYLAFLNDPANLAVVDEAMRRQELVLVPRDSAFASEPLWKRASGFLSGGGFLLETSREGVRFDPRSPVGNISHQDAMAYAAWLARRARRPWRLPEVAEWQLAMQGGDGRAHPWGDAADLALCASGPSWQRDRSLGDNPAMRFAADRSVQGVWDLAGSRSEWCLPLPGMNPSLRPLLGGGLGQQQPERFTSWSRRDVDWRVVNQDTGVRLVYTP